MRVKTFRNRRLSILQSALSQHLYEQGDASSETWNAASHAKMQAVAAVGKHFEHLSPSDKLPPLPSAKAVADAKQEEDCAHAVIDLLFGGMKERVRAAAELNPFGPCDLGWLSVIAHYYENLWFGGKIPYIAATSPGDSVFNLLPEKCRIGIIGDWGTGTQTAQLVLEQLKRHREERPDAAFLLLHLGDVYYSGSAAEFSRFEKQIRACFPNDPVFTLAGNHDMYSGGTAFYDCIAKLNKEPFVQKTSFFNLNNQYWQFQAMDTGLHDRDPFEVSSDLTYLEPSEITWHRQQLSDAGSRKVILLSHHQPFSAFTCVGKDENKNAVQVNERLLSVFNGAGPDATGDNFLPKIKAWLFGHEHNTIIYGPFKGVDRARCIGSSAIPAAAEDDPYKVVDPSIPWDQSVRLSVSDDLYGHGYAVMDLDQDRGRIQYYQYPFQPGEESLWAEEI